MKKRWPYMITIITFLGIQSCSKSPLGPQMGDKEPTSTSTTTRSGSVPTTSTGANTCSLTSGHTTYYLGETVTLVFNCTDEITTVTTTNAPTFLTSSTSGATLTFTGVSDAVATTAWSFVADTKSNSINTIIIDRESNITVSLASSVDITNSRATNLDVSYSATLSTDWDGDATNTALGVSAISSTGAHGLTLQSSCTSATSHYLCQQSPSFSSPTAEGDLKINWQWSSFDQGTYYVTLTPKMTLEAGEIALADKTFSFSVAKQTNTYQITTQGDVTNSSSTQYNTDRYKYAINVNSQKSTATLPVVGTIYTTFDGDHAHYFQRFSIDRTSSSTSGAGITASSALMISDRVTTGTSATSRLWNLTSLSDGNWVALGAALDTQQEIYFVHITDSASAPTKTRGVTLTTYTADSKDTYSLAMTEPFTDSDSTVRIGIAQVYSQGANYIFSIGKINPAGTATASIVDQSAYGVNTPGHSITSTNFMDRVKIAHFTSGSTGYFVAAYRETDDISMVRINSDNTSGYDQRTSTVVTNGVTDAHNATASEAGYQRLDIATGTYSSAPVIGMVYKKSDGTCAFLRVNEDLSTITGPLSLTTNTCFGATIAFHAASSRFVVTLTEKTDAGNYEIKTTEITMGDTDSKSSFVTIIDQDDSNAAYTTYPVNFQTNLYDTGHLMMMYYRFQGTSIVKLHGYHVSKQ